MLEVTERNMRNTPKLNDWSSACKLCFAKCTKLLFYIDILLLWNHTTRLFTLLRRYPSAPCSYIDANKLSSQCLQKHNFVRLLAYTYEDGLHIDSFKMPVACSCHINGPPKHYG